ncbi:MAG: FG-GAP repeat protein [Nitrospirae bacterium]|nr:FG-GAP repeat protein [Nitrospirota bacterium]
MNGLSIANSGYVQKGVPNNWQIKVVGDYNGDGKADILWEDTSKGDIYVYLMDGVNISGGGFVSFGMTSDWQPK